MPNQKIIEGLEPFNEIFYRDCFYNSFFPIVNYFKRDIFSFLVNDIVAYKEDNETSNLNFNIDYLSVNPFAQICSEECLIQSECKEKSEDLVQDIIESINKERPVIVFIDCYYEKIRPEMYKKVHWFHTITVFGYDIEDKTFDIIEHKYKDNLGYMKRKIGFLELKECNDGFIQNCLEKVGNFAYSFYSFYLDKSLEENYYPKDKKSLCDTFKSNLLLKKQEIVCGINSLENFSKSLEEIVLKETVLKDKAEDILNIINNIINCKRVEQYKMNILYCENYEIINLIDLILEEWNRLRKVIVKYLVSGVYKVKDIEKAIESIKEIVELENIYIEKI
ncbi:hypothetical protein [Clostridium sp.]|uniref:hypothetical protein n=1 Tax=Clostridium sp. TaxID=1506 RepID=UPI00261C623B|nr:hypothetical protein [Clostridium sp.]